MPKAVQALFRHDRRLFAEVSRLIFAPVSMFFRQAAERDLRTGMIVTHQTYGDILRFNRHFHAIVL
ncbi:MAG: IS91 family transposase, partial [Spirochaetaceae bacterium]|nr:IS91 family transposase [Spirochaetaceae bacterium]